MTENPRDKKGAEFQEEQGAEQHARYITEQQLEEAVEKQRGTGKSLWEILMSQLSLKSIKDLMTYEIWPRGESLRNVMVRNGHTTEEELNRIVVQEEREGLRVGDILIDRGVISRAQLGKALIEQERSGHPLTRVLLNKGYVNAKQLSDALRLDRPTVAPKLHRQKVFEAVRNSGEIGEEHLHELEVQARNAGSDLAEVLVQEGYLSANKLGELLGQHLGAPYVNLSHHDIDEQIARMLPENVVRTRRALPIEYEDGKIQVAMTDPDDVTAIDDISMISGCKVTPLLTWEKQLEQAITRVFGSGESPPARQLGRRVKEKKEAESAKTPEPVRQDTSANRMDELVESVSVVNLVGSILEGAINANATDVHLEPQAEHLRVRYRIDGVLYDVMTIPQAVQAGVVSRVKILANMDITVHRVPQDGHYSIEIGESAYDMRIATLPTSQGERLVIRLLNPQNIFLGLKQLGLSATDYERVESLIYQPHGMFLATGPIGAGKTTTLYAAVNRVNVLSDSIVTIEDPIEYELPGINQVQVEPKANRTFSNVLRALLRQDVDTMLVGEIRDIETANIATRAAVTGHSLYTSMHTRDTVSAITSLTNLGISPFLVASAVTGIVNQRLVRRVCPQCSEEYTPSRELLNELGLPPDNPENMKFVHGQGCSACYHTGYHGRIGVFEVLVLTDRIKELIMNGATEQHIQRAAVEEGMTTLHNDAVAKLREQITSAEDVIRTVATHT